MNEHTLTETGRTPFFSHDPQFYKSWVRLFLLLALQNIVTYSVNVADNIMLGMYSQTALSGAAAVNQIQYVLQQVIGSGLGDGLAVLGAQLWGRHDTDSLEKLSGQALFCGWVIGLVLTAVAFIAPEGMVRLFTSDAAIVAEGTAYLRVMRWSYLVFITTTLILCTLRSVQIAGIAFRLSVMALVVNVGINRVLIFGALGFPELGIRGAAVGTLIARVLELIVLLLWCMRKGHVPFSLSPGRLFRHDGALLRRYTSVALPCVISALLFSGSVAMQTVVMGHLNADAIAANSAAATLFQYCKMIPIGASAASGAVIGRIIGTGDTRQLRSDVHTLQAIFIGLGLLMGGLLSLISGPIISLYTLTDQARTYAEQMIVVLSVVAVCTGYQMPCLVGVIRGGGDTRFVLRVDIIFGCVIVVPLSCCAAFLWHWSVPMVTLCLYIDQLVKVFVVTIRLHGTAWVKRLTESV